MKPKIAVRAVEKSDGLDQLVHLELQKSRDLTHSVEQMVELVNTETLQKKVNQLFPQQERAVPQVYYGLGKDLRKSLRTLLAANAEIDRRIRAEHSPLYHTYLELRTFITRSSLKQMNVNGLYGVMIDETRTVRGYMVLVANQTASLATAIDAYINEYLTGIGVMANIIPSYDLQTEKMTELLEQFVMENNFSGSATSERMQQLIIARNLKNNIDEMYRLRDVAVSYERGLAREVSYTQKLAHLFNVAREYFNRLLVTSDIAVRRLETNRVAIEGLLAQGKVTDALIQHFDVIDGCTAKLVGEANEGMRKLRTVYSKVSKGQYGNITETSLGTTIEEFGEQERETFTADQFQ